MLTLLPARRAALAACAALAIVPVAAGCGESSGGNAGADPASVVPGSAPLYGEAVVKPEGDQRARVESLLRRVMRTDDPGGALERAIDKGLRKDHATYAHDIKPWLGKRIGAFLSGVTRGGNAQGAIVVATSDPQQAFKSVHKGEKVKAKRTYRDVSYDVLEDDTAVAVVGDFLVGGTEGALRQVVDTSKDSGHALSNNDDYGDARGEAGSDGLGIVYADPQGLLDVATSSGVVDRTMVTGLRQVLGKVLGRAFAASVQAEDAGASVTTAAIGLGKKSSVDSGDAPGALAAVPDDAWLAFGFGNIGARIEEGLKQAGTLGGLGGVDIDTLLGQLRRSSGIDLRRDVLDWMGDGALFVRGTSGADIGGAIVVRSKDPERSKAVVGKIARFARSQGLTLKPLTGVAGVDAGETLKIPGAPEISIAAAGNRFVLAVGRPSLEAALQPGERLGANPDFRRAAAQLGSGIKPGFYFNVAPVLQLADSFGAGQSAGYRKAKPYLKAFSAIVAGGKRDGDVGRGQLFVVVR